jgi:hypothetical protein
MIRGRQSGIGVRPGTQAERASASIECIGRGHAFPHRKNPCRELPYANPRARHATHRNPYPPGTPDAPARHSTSGALYDLFSAPTFLGLPAVALPPGVASGLVTCGQPDVAPGRRVRSGDADGAQRSHLNARLGGHRERVRDRRNSVRCGVASVGFRIRVRPVTVPSGAGAVVEVGGEGGMAASTHFPAQRRVG